MAIELFLGPMEGSGTITDPYRAKYTRDASIVASGSIRYSHSSVGLVLINALQAYLDSVRGQSDVTSLATPANIDQTLTNGMVNAAKTLFEANGIPAGFVNIGDTRREVVRALAGLFLFSQRLEGRFGSGFWQLAQSRGIGLDSIWNGFPQALKDEFIAVRDEHGWDNLGLTGLSTLREILTAVSNQFEGTPIVIAGVSI